MVGPESRGFIFGVPVAYAAHKAFVPVRKKGKLPCETISMEYDLEYGSAVIEMHKDAIKEGQKVVIVADLIATGGTIEAIIKLVEKLGGEVVKICFVMELAGLKGREKLAGYPVESVITYEGKMCIRDSPMVDMTDRVLYAYWNTCTDAFIESYDKQVYAWCEEKKIRFIGEKPILRSKELAFTHCPGIDAGHQKAGDQPDVYKRQA